MFGHPVVPAAVCSEITKSSTINKSNAQHAILFEAISLILALDCSRDLLATSVNSLGRFLSVKVRQLCRGPHQDAGVCCARDCVVLYAAMSAAGNA
jgi:hypothetical protein